MKIAVPRLGETVAPCFGYCTTMAIFAIEEGRVVDQVDFALCSREPFDRVRLLRDQGVDAIICGGVQDVFEAALKANGIHVISWVSGKVDDLLGLYLKGQLVPAKADKGKSW